MYNDAHTKLSYILIQFTLHGLMFCYNLYNLTENEKKLNIYFFRFQSTIFENINKFLHHLFFYLLTNPVFVT